MKFTKLRLSGFKSFVEPTEFLIEPGLTGVVGPNGCGKSNLVEALRWVMGENSYKNMRASGMDDVIFSGSGKRPSRNTAEVALHLDNSARTAPAGFNESDQLEVSRRIEREVGSVYRINSRDVRARDVQLLFADASTGSRSPSMVRQGQIGELIAAKPASRRAILEEASGISGLHSRRQEAETRLKAAETNLDRLEDVLSGIETQIEGLGRQARQASRYRHLSADIRSGEAAIAHMRWSAARGHIAETEQALAEADATVIDRAGRQARAARDAAVGAQALPGLREAEAREAAGLQRLKLALSELDAEERRVKERLSDLARRLAQLAEDRSREERMAGDMAEALTRLEAEEQDLAEGDLETQALTEELNERVVTAEAEAGEAERLFASLQAEAAGLEARRHELTRAAEEAVARQRSLEAQAATVMTEKQALTERIEATRDDDEASMRLETATEAVVAAEDLVAATEEEALTRRAALETARAGLATAEREVDRLEAEARALEKMLAGEAKSAMPPLIDAITVKAGYETALGAALGDDLDVTTDTGAPIHWSQPGPGDADPPLPAGATPLSEVISGPAVMARRLAQIGLVAAADGARLQLQLKSGQRLVSRNGDLWRWDGLSAKADAPTAAARRLGARNRLVEIASDGTVARDRLSVRRSETDAAMRAADLAAGQERSAREALKQAVRTQAEAREALARIERDLAQLTNRLAAVTEAEKRTAADAAEAVRRQHAALAELSGLPASSGLQERLGAARTEAQLKRASLAEAKAACQGAMREAEMRNRRREAIERERAGWRMRAANSASQIAILDNRRDEAEADREALLERPEAIEAERRRLFGLVEAAEQARSAAADTLARAERGQAEIDLASRAALEQLSFAREAKARAEERHASARERRDEIEAQIAENFSVPPAGLLALAGLKEAPGADEIDVLEKKLERLRLERERLGSVNLRADDELKELTDKRDALVKERDDLIEAIRRLRQGIGNLNREARERLMGAFETVDRHFRALFTLLFGGGSAELQLIESDDPLEAGLEIFARPPGKKPSTMTLLSGGEQALTALALIFAVFLTNPAPICVLDEVDAPLDDANVERYCDLLADMAGRTETRFVVITHNPITMARMDRLYGVTMSERGVSQLVSVDLAVAERILGELA